jgi:protoporphyrinogen oxidase
MTRRRIAVVGGGVSGVTAGYVLSRTDPVTLFEADDRLGGHADTHPTGVDTGFIVYNERTYPLLTRLFAELGVATLASPLLMTFILTRGTGARMTDRRMTASRPHYTDYVARTSGFIPLPPKRAPKRSAAAAAPGERA